MFLIYRHLYRQLSFSASEGLKILNRYVISAHESFLRCLQPLRPICSILAFSSASRFRSFRGLWTHTSNLCSFWQCSSSFSMCSLRCRRQHAVSACIWAHDLTQMSKRSNSSRHTDVKIRQLGQFFLLSAAVLRRLYSRILMPDREDNMPKSRYPSPMSGRKMHGMLVDPIDEPPSLSGTLLSIDLKPETLAGLESARQRYIQDQRNNRIEKLGDHYGIDAKNPWNMSLLLVKLAEDFVLGFTTRKPKRNTKSGRPKNPADRPTALRLVSSVGQITIEGYTVLEACKRLSKSRGEWNGVRAAVLKRRYARFSRELFSEREARIRHPYWGAVLAETLRLKKRLSGRNR